ncbi:hypothetical protein Nepgr_021442 [Nepenthes gracilis]|uniref:Uncharacterized protein n=1 Tax=Nepenthes gracilis TaxID=150966 RepID=A0AAD3SZ29_NEPGR|nr:hypothetical protein Nepgr_021442 [Nepenthes gracilis]
MDDEASGLIPWACFAFPPARVAYGVRWTCGAHGAGVTSSPSQTLERSSTPPPLDLLPSDFSASLSSHLPRSATPWPRLPLTPAPSPFPLSRASDPDLLLPTSASGLSPTQRTPSSILGVAPSLDSISIPTPVGAADCPPCPPAQNLLVPDGFFFDPMNMDGSSAHSYPVDAFVCRTPSSVAPFRADECGGTKEHSNLHICSKGLSLPSTRQPSGRFEKHEIPIAGSGKVASPILDMVTHCSSIPLPADDPMHPEISTSNTLSNPIDPASSSQGVSWASVVEKRTIGAPGFYRWLKPLIAELNLIVSDAGLLPPFCFGWGWCLACFSRADAEMML